MPFNIVHRWGDIDYPGVDWWEVWFNDEHLICGFSTEEQAIEYRDTLNTEYMVIATF